MSNEITNDMDVIDSRDIIERIEELESEFEDYKNTEGNNDCTMEEWGEVDSNAVELIALLTLAEEGEEYSLDWSYGSQLIHRNYFAQEAR